MTETDKIIRLETRMDSLEKEMQQIHVHQAVNTERYDNIIKKLAVLESNTMWMTRLVIGAIIAAGLNFVFAGGLNAIT